VSDGFRGRPGQATATFGVDEVRVLRALCGELVELIRNESPEPSDRSTTDPIAAMISSLGAGSTEPPEDDVLHRLFPSAYAEDEEAAGEFRRFTEGGLRDGKVGNAEVMLDSLGDPAFSDRVTVELNAEEQQAWLKTLTDLRLALGTRLGIENDDDDRWATLPLEDRRRQVYGVYVWLGFLQESLINTLW
jgi:Domain of unknown function (DUF2017)